MNDAICNIRFDPLRVDQIPRLFLPKEDVEHPKPVALVVECEREAMANLVEVLRVHGHRYDLADSLEVAREFWKCNEYSYAVVSLSIPASKNGPARAANGMAMVREILMGQPRRVPVVVVSDQSPRPIRLVVEAMQQGAVDFVLKPLGESEALDTAIRRVETSLSAKTKPPRPDARERTFSGGKLRLFPERAELLGVEIIRSSHKGTNHGLAILRTLAERDSQGRYVRLDGGELAAMLGRLALIGTVTGSIRKIRHNAAARLLRHLHLEVGDSDLIVNDEQGYSLRDWIDVQIVEEEESVPASRNAVSAFAS